MINKIYFSAIFIALVFSQDIYLENYSSSFTIDTIEPEIEVTSQNSGGGFMGGQPIRITWTAFDNSPIDNPINLYLKIDQGTQTIPILQGVPNTGIADVILPEVTTAFGQFYIEYVDDYGNISSDYNDAYFTIGDIDDNPFENLEISLESTSLSFTIDTIEPEIEVTSQNSGGGFIGGQPIRITWTAFDNSPVDNPINLYLKIDQGAQTIPIMQGISNSGLVDIVMPDATTAFGQFYIEYNDKFGNISFDYNDEYFTIGDIDDNPFENTEISLEELSNMFVVDTKKPEFLPINNNGDFFYPNGEELFENYEFVPVEWNASDDSFENGNLTISLAYMLGGWYEDILSCDALFPGIEADLTSYGNIDPTIWARLKFTLKDDFGNYSVRYNDDYFILGNPEGDISVDLLDEADNTYVLEWGWRDNHLIAINHEAMSMFSAGDIIYITDQNGINSYNCDGLHGPVQLASYVVTGEETEPIAIMLESGYNYCDQGGDISLGYMYGNPISFSMFDASSNSSHELVAHEVNTDAQCVFDNQSTLIYDFSMAQFIGNGNSLTRDSNIINLNQNLIPTSEVLLDDREIDTYNIYRSTSAANLRDYELIQNNVVQSYYFDNFAALDETINQTICYRVWLLNTYGDEILKTVDSCIGYVVDYLTGDITLDGQVNILDVVSLVQYILFDTEYSEVQLINADYNLDSTINVLDVVAIVQYILDS